MNDEDVKPVNLTPAPEGYMDWLANLIERELEDEDGGACDGSNADDEA